MDKISRNCVRTMNSDLSNVDVKSIEKFQVNGLCVIEQIVQIGLI